MARLACAPRRVKDPTFKIPAAVKTGHDNKGDYYIEHADVEREFNMNLHYNDVRVKLDDKGLFDIGGYDIVKKDFIPFKKIYTLTLKYNGDKYYSTSYEETYTANEDENGNILIDRPYEGTFEVYGFDQYHGAEVDSNISKYGVLVWMGIDGSMIMVI